MSRMDRVGWWVHRSSLLHQFSIDAVTNSHEVSGLKRCKFIIPQFCSSVCPWSHRGNIEVLAGMCPLWRRQRRVHFLAFSSLLRLPAFLGSWHPSCIFKGSNLASQTLLHHISFSDSLYCLPLPLLRTLVITLGLPR